MQTILDTIIEHKKAEIKSLYKNRGKFGDRKPSPHRPFAKAIRKENAIAIIAEVKKASPSKGIIRNDFDPVAIAQKYEKGGASAVSVLTDEKFFQGSNNNLIRVRESIALPILRKEFIIDPIQVEETASLNADAMLLITAALSDAQMKELYEAAIESGIEPLIEIHSGKELDRAMKIEPLIIGINNRNLKTFSCDIAISLDLAQHIPKNVTIISESGIDNGKQTDQLMKAGVHSVLVGESLVKLDDPSSLIKELSHAG